ncbi:MAG: hypothetical protein HY689_08900 [Chloroflexi bacterium]|nr:hypothetical protein [Chloroflexota bacterium]
MLQPGDWDARTLEDLKAQRFPPDRAVADLRYESHQPPLYYLLATPVAFATASWPLADQVRALRLFSLAWSLVLLLIAAALVRRLVPESPGLALAVPAFIAVIPQHTAIAAAVNNDVLAEVIFSLVLLALAHRIARGVATPPRSLLDRLAGPVGLGVLLGLALLTKATVYAAALLIPLGILIAPEGGGGGHSRVRSLLGQMLVVYAVALLVAGWWFVRNALVYGSLDLTGLGRHDAVVVGQPRSGPLTLAFVQDFVLITFRSFWVQLGWMGVPAEGWVYVLLSSLTALATVGLLLFLARSARQAGVLSTGLGRALGLASLAVLLVAFQMAGYNLQFFQPQGRYLFPAIIPIALLLLLGLREVSAPRYHTMGFLGLLATLLLLNGYVVQRLIPYLRP